MGFFNTENTKMEVYTEVCIFKIIILNETNNFLTCRGMSLRQTVDPRLREDDERMVDDVIKVNGW